MQEDKYGALRLENQLCFPLYVCAKEIVRRYKPYLDPLELTYTQYIAMMVLWERGTVTVSQLGQALYLDSGTLTPLLKKLEQKGLVTRSRQEHDERSVAVSVTEKGMALRERALGVPEEMMGCLSISREDAEALYGILHRLMAGL